MSIGSDFRMYRTCDWVHPSYTKMATGTFVVRVTVTVTRAKRWTVDR